VCSYLQVWLSSKLSKHVFLPVAKTDFNTPFKHYDWTGKPFKFLCCLNETNYYFLTNKNALKGPKFPIPLPRERELAHRRRFKWAPCPLLERSFGNSVKPCMVDSGWAVRGSSDPRVTALGHTGTGTVLQARRMGTEEKKQNEPWVLGEDRNRRSYAFFMFLWVWREVPGPPSLGARGPSLSRTHLSPRMPGQREFLHTGSPAGAMKRQGKTSRKWGTTKLCLGLPSKPNSSCPSYKPHCQYWRCLWVNTAKFYSQLVAISKRPLLLRAWMP
jgi:hypothetical protein